MVRIFLKVLIVILFIIGSLIAYLSLIGIETKSFNNQIKENLKKIDTRLDVKLNDVKIVLDILNLDINAKIFGPVIFYNNKQIDIELIKSNISLLNLLNKDFSFSNLFISTKSVKLKDTIAFYRAINDNKKAELFVLENFISKGYLIADININFDDQGNIKDDLKINGLVKDSTFKLLSKQKINDINFIFEIQNKDLDINDLNFSYNKINFTSKKVEFRNKNSFVQIDGEINSDEVNLSEELLNNIFDPFFKLDFKNLKFSSQNKFLFKINNKFKVSEYIIKSYLDIDEATIKNNIDLKNFFPNLLSEIKFKDHQTELIYQKDNLEIMGNGKFLSQKNFDSIKYKIERKKDNYLFNVKLNFNDNPIYIDFLNYKSIDKSKVNLNLDGTIFKDKTLNLEKIEFKNGSDFITVNNLKLTNDFKISNLNSAIFDFTDTQKIKNIFNIKNDGKSYFITGKVLNASKLIDDLIFEDSINKKIFEKDYAVKINLKEVYLHDNHIVYDLIGNLKFKDNNIVNAKINSKFSDNESIAFTIISNDNQKVTTLFSDQAKPFVKKFNFIKGFEKGSLDFYSVKSKEITNSKLKIYDFSLKELPALTKILTLASLQGIADLLSGEGIGFSEFEMNFENKGKLMKIDEIYAIGPAISILMEGYIEKSKLVSLRGTLVPATTINKAIGSIPILGNILVGKKTGEGVFGVSFKIKGPPKKLETTVNPIKTLTPRFITRTLEKIKKN
mgnify:FL=1